VKRLAVEVEDHPVEYADFEGSIPEGNYGAGTVIVWDQGRWEPLEDFDEGLEKGKILFELKGYKMRGVWQLVRTKSREKKDSKEWLLIKKPDAWSRTKDPDAFPQESNFSGLTLEELREEPPRGGDPRAPVALEAPRRAVDLQDRPMLASCATTPLPATSGSGSSSTTDSACSPRARRGARACSTAATTPAIFPDRSHCRRAPLRLVHPGWGGGRPRREGAPLLPGLQSALLTRRSDIERATVDLGDASSSTCSPRGVRSAGCAARAQDTPADGLPGALARRPSRGGPEMLEQVARWARGIVGKGRRAYRAGRSRDWIKSDSRRPGTS
jgi:bifunctional non-homologous end joining protein LigD